MYFVGEGGEPGESPVKTASSVEVTDSNRQEEEKKDDGTEKGKNSVHILTKK